MGALAALAASSPALAHPMGAWVSHYTRFQAEKSGLRMRYILDMAEIPTVTEKAALDRNNDGTASVEEQSAYLRAKTVEILGGIALAVDGCLVKPQFLHGDAHLHPGAGSLHTLKIRIDFHVPIAPRTGGYTLAYRDGYLANRTGWKEIVATGGRGARIQDSTAPSTDRSRELSVYPPDLIPPQETEARFKVVPGEENRTPQPIGAALGNSSPPAAADKTPHDSFTEWITRRDLSPGLMLIGLLIAFMFGAFHALSPGHGKAMVAAYLVGAQGTAKHAFLLGLIVTITHTLGVFLLGFVTLFASQYVVPEKLYPILSVISGLAVLAVGASLLYRRARGLADDHHHHHEHNHSHTHNHDHPHDHAHDHHHHHHPLPEGPVTARSLIALGISGGLVPCPSALVVLLAAINLHRIAYGMLLITAFSVGLASVLISIGLMVVSARDWFDRLPSSGGVLRRLPVASAAMITLIGIVLVVRAFLPGAP